MTDIQNEDLARIADNLEEMADQQRKIANQLESLTLIQARQAEHNVHDALGYWTATGPSEWGEDD